MKPLRTRHVAVEKFGRQTQRVHLRSSLGIGPHDCVIMIVGRLAKEKGHEIFLKAAAQVIKDVQNVKFIISQVYY